MRFPSHRSVLGFPMPNNETAPTCDVCGKPAAVIIQEIPWCEGCFHEMGSCCGEWHEENDTGGNRDNSGCDKPRENS